jgi:uncharacterized protein YciI
MMRPVARRTSASQDNNVRVVMPAVLILSMLLILSCGPSHESNPEIEAHTEASVTQNASADDDSAAANDDREVPVTMEYFVFLYARDTGWVDGRPAFEQPFLQDHFEHMTRLENEGTLVIGGAFKDETGVMGILKAGSLEQAQQIIADDPVIQNKILKADVKAWTPSVTGRIE